MSKFQNLGVWQEQEVSQDEIMLLEPRTINLKSKYQRRHRLIAEKVDEMAAEFSRLPEGQSPKTVVLVVPSKEYGVDWDIVYGAHRVAAAMAAGKKIPAFNGAEMSEADRVRTAIAENLLRQDPNPLERVESILQLAEVEVGLSQQRISGLLSWDHNGQKAARDNDVPGDWERFCAFLEAIPGGMKPSTFYKRYMPLLSMPDVLTEAVRDGAIDYTKALELKKLSGEKLEAAIANTIELGLSLAEVKAQVGAHSKSAVKEDGFKVAATRLRAIKPEKMEPSLRDAISAKVKELMDLLEQAEG